MSEIVKGDLVRVTGECCLPPSRQTLIGVVSAVKEVVPPPPTTWVCSVCNRGMAFGPGVVLELPCPGGENHTHPNEWPMALVQKIEPPALTTKAKEKEPVLAGGVK